jgi:gluconokinase
MKHLRLEDDGSVERELAERTTPEHGLSVLPFWMAERAPTWRDDLSGAIAGITQATTAIDLLQAITEATYQRLAQVAELLPESRRDVTFIVGGGIQKSPAALQRLANVLGHAVVATNDPETSLRGAAVFALEKLGVRKLGSSAGKSIRPNRRAVDAYAKQRHELQRLESVLFPR